MNILDFSKSFPDENACIEGQTRRRQSETVESSSNDRKHCCRKPKAASCCRFSSSCNNDKAGKGFLFFATNQLVLGMTKEKAIHVNKQMLKLVEDSFTHNDTKK
jgi:hypothetical protein